MGDADRQRELGLTKEYAQGFAAGERDGERQGREDLADIRAVLDAWGLDGDDTSPNAVREFYRQLRAIIDREPGREDADEVPDPTRVLCLSINYLLRTRCRLAQGHAGVHANGAGFWS